MFTIQVSFCTINAMCIALLHSLMLRGEVNVPQHPATQINNDSSTFISLSDKAAHVILKNKLRILSGSIRIKNIEAQHKIRHSYKNVCVKQGNQLQRQIYFSDFLSSPCSFQNFLLVSLQFPFAYFFFPNDQISLQYGNFLTLI